MERLQVLVTAASFSVVLASLLALSKEPAADPDIGFVAPPAAPDVARTVAALPAPPTAEAFVPKPEDRIDSCELASAHLSTCSATPLQAMPQAVPRDVDEMFLEARELAFTGNRESARALAREILVQTPEYLDVSVFLARVHAWDGEYDVARGLISRVLASDPSYLEARKVAIDVALWSGNARDALLLVEAAAAAAPDDPELLDRRERVRHALDALGPAGGDHVADGVHFHGAEHARMVLARSFDDGPRARSREPGVIVDEEVREPRVRYRAAVEYFLNHFSKNLDDWHQVNVSLEREAKWGSVIGRIGYYNRFQDSAALFELDVYPQLRRGTYAYLNASVSTRDILPDYRLAAEIYQALPFGFEASVGWRQVRFDFTTNTVSPSLGWYKGNYWFLVRPLISFAKGESTVSWVGRVRRYFSDPEEYITLTFAKGRAVEADAGSPTLFLLDSIGGLTEGRKRIFERYVVKIAIGYESQELPGRSDRGRLTFGAGLEYIF